MPPLNPGQKVYKKYFADSSIIEDPVAEMTTQECYTPSYEFSILVNPLSKNALKFTCKKWQGTDGPWAIVHQVDVSTVLLSFIEYCIYRRV